MCHKISRARNVLVAFKTSPHALNAMSAELVVGPSTPLGVGDQRVLTAAKGADIWFEVRENVKPT